MGGKPPFSVKLFECRLATCHFGSSHQCVAFGVAGGTRPPVFFLWFQLAWCHVVLAGACLSRGHVSGALGRADLRLCYPQFVVNMGTCPGEPRQCAGPRVDPPSSDSGHHLWPADPLCIGDDYISGLHCTDSHRGGPVGIGVACCQAGRGIGRCRPIGPRIGGLKHHQVTQCGGNKGTGTCLEGCSSSGHCAKAGGATSTGGKIYLEPQIACGFRPVARSRTCTCASPGVGRAGEFPRWSAPYQLRDALPSWSEDCAEAEANCRCCAVRRVNPELGIGRTSILSSLAKLFQDVPGLSFHDFPSGCVSDLAGSLLRDSKRVGVCLPRQLACRNESGKPHEGGAVHAVTRPVGPSIPQRNPPGKVRVRPKYGMGRGVQSSIVGPCLLGRAGEKTGGSPAFQCEGLPEPWDESCEGERAGRPRCRSPSRRKAKGEGSSSEGYVATKHPKIETARGHATRWGLGFGRSPPKEDEAFSGGIPQRKVYEQRPSEEVGWPISYHSRGETHMLYLVERRSAELLQEPVQGWQGAPLSDMPWIPSKPGLRSRTSAWKRKICELAAHMDRTLNRCLTVGRACAPFNVLELGRWHFGRGRHHEHRDSIAAIVKASPVRQVKFGATGQTDPRAWDFACTHGQGPVVLVSTLESRRSSGRLKRVPCSERKHSYEEAVQCCRALVQTEALVGQQAQGRQRKLRSETRQAGTRSQDRGLHVENRPHLEVRVMPCRHYRGHWGFHAPSITNCIRGHSDWRVGTWLHWRSRKGQRARCSVVQGSVSLQLCVWWKATRRAFSTRQAITGTAGDSKRASVPKPKKGSWLTRSAMLRSRSSKLGKRPEVRNIGQWVWPGSAWNKGAPGGQCTVCIRAEAGSQRCRTVTIGSKGRRGCWQLGGNQRYSPARGECKCLAVELFNLLAGQRSQGMKGRQWPATHLWGRCARRLLDKQVKSQRARIAGKTGCRLKTIQPVPGRVAQATCAYTGQVTGWQIKPYGGSEHFKGVRCVWQGAGLQPWFCKLGLGDLWLSCWPYAGSGWQSGCGWCQWARFVSALTGPRVSNGGQSALAPAKVWGGQWAFGWGQWVTSWPDVSSGRESVVCSGRCAVGWCGWRFALVTEKVWGSQCAVGGCQWVISWPGTSSGGAAGAP